MSKKDTLEKRLEGLEELLTLAIRVGEFHISRNIRDTIKVVERELKIETNVK
jgi:protein-arginine kinase activator protein McsA